VVFGLAQSSLPGAAQIQIPGTPGAPGGTPSASVTPTATPPPAPAGSLQQLLDQARAASSEAQADLDRLRAILDEIARQGGTAATPTSTPAP
jgi:hypothetical protein